MHIPRGLNGYFIGKINPTPLPACQRTGSRIQEVFAQTGLLILVP